MKRSYHAYLLLLGLFGGVAIASDCCRTECTPKNSCQYEVTSKSYLPIRPNFQSVSPEMVSGFRGDRLHAMDDGMHGVAQAVVFGGKTTNSRELARYFFPNGKTELIVDEGVAFASNVAPEAPNATYEAYPPLPQDLLAAHFNIFTMQGTFRSKISIRPEQTSVGVGFQVRKGFCINEEKGRGFFTSLSFPIISVRNNLGFEETVINDGGGANFDANVDENVAANMTQAFVQPGWSFGKISSFTQKKTKVADIEFKLGYEWIQQEPFHLESYLGMIIPTGNKPSGQFLFEPIVGNGRHWGIMFGNSLGIEIYRNEAKNRSFRMEYASNTNFLFKNVQCRSLDLVGRPWSRYIQLYASEEQAATADFLAGTGESPELPGINFSTPGINILTLPLSVRPGFNYNTTASALFRSNNWSLEAGYNLYVRASECVKLECPWTMGPAIKFLSGQGFTNPIRDITGNYRKELYTGAENSEARTDYHLQQYDYKNNQIKEEDLDLITAAAPGMISHTFYGAGGYTWDRDNNHPVFAYVGGSYEFSNSNNAVPERWTLWGKLGISF